MFEGSAGSTAISIATVAPAFGCKCHVVIPDDAAIEKVFFFFCSIVVDFLSGRYARLVFLFQNFKWWILLNNLHRRKKKNRAYTFY